MVNFANNNKLGKVAELTKAYSFGVDPINSYNDIIFVAGGNKFSTTCGFRFKSKLPGIPHPFFRVAFCTKFRSNIYHQINTNPSKWFILQTITPTEIRVLSKRDLLDTYGFDVDEFFASDMFAKYIKLFEKSCMKGIAKAEEFIEEQDDDVDDLAVNQRDNPRSNAKAAVETLRDSIPLISKPIVNNKTYLLYDLDAKK